MAITTPRCPEHIFRMFESESTIAEGRAEAVKWMQSVVPNMKVGDEIIIPDGATGEPVVFKKDQAQH